MILPVPLTRPAEEMMTPGSTPTRDRAFPPERRSIRRQEPVASRARIVWREGVSQFRKLTAHLVDISEKGARIVSPCLPGNVRSVWVGLEALPCEWVKATIQSVVPEPGGWSFHLTFREPCPVGLLETATGVELGPSPYGEPPLSFYFELD